MGNPKRGRQGEAGGCPDVEVADHQGCGSPNSGDEEREPDAIRSSDGYSIFPPGPADSEAWEAILRERPDLAPAVADGNRRGFQVQREQESSRIKGSQRDEPDGCNPEELADCESRGVQDSGAVPQEAGGRSAFGNLDGSSGCCQDGREETQSSVRRVAHGPANRVDRLRACGNAVVPATVATALRTLAKEQL